MSSSWVRNTVAAWLLLGASSWAIAQALTFEGLRDSEQVLNFYNGGLGSLGSGPGPNLGITFGSGALSVIENTRPTGQGNFRNAPSPFTVMVFPIAGTTAVMNVPAGFSTGFSFFYASSVPATVDVYAGVNKTGVVLATISLPANNAGTQCASAPPAFFCNFSPAGVSFAGTAMSVDFGGTANRVAFDNITLQSATPAGTQLTFEPARPVPTLGQIGLILLALFAGIGGALAIRKGRR